MVTKRTVKKNLSVRDTIGLNLLITFYQLIKGRLDATGEAGHRGTSGGQRGDRVLNQGPKGT